jgi:hypothetical protein
MIIALAKFGISSGDEAKVLEKRWTAYRRTNSLDLYGRAVESLGSMQQPCGHPSLDDSFR